MSTEAEGGSMKRFAEIRSSRPFIILTVAVAVFADLFNYSIVIPILPTILDRRVHVPPEKLQVTLAGMLAAYNAANIISSPISGYLADKWSNRKIPLLAGLLALTGSTVLFAVAKNVGLLYLARILQGASGSIVWSVGFALLVDSVPTEEVGTAMGWASVGLSLGNTSGPLVGGIVYQRAGHYATFAMAFAVVAIDIVFRCILREPGPRSNTPSKETPSQDDLTCQAAKSHDSEGKSSEASPPTSPISEKHAINDKSQLENKSGPPKVLILKLLTYPAMISSLFCVFTVLAVLTGLESVIPLHVERTFGWSTEGAGLIFLGLAVPIFLTPIFGYLHGRWGPRPLSITGLVIIAVFGLLLALVRSHTVTLVALLVVFLVAIGIGITLVMTPEMAEISAFGETKAKEEPEVFGQGATAQCCALMTIANSLGGIVGPVVIGHVKSASGWIPTSITVGAFAVFGLIVLIALTAYEKVQRKEMPVATKQSTSVQDEETGSAPVPTEKHDASG